MNKIFGLAVLALSFAACQNSGNDSSRTTNAPANTPTFSTPVTPAQPEQGNPQTVTSAPATSTPAAAPAQPASSSGALNPAHGMPGHRCDIPEGAPLNSAPASAATTPAATQSPIMMQPQPPAPAPTGGSNVKLNPPHGQPGHDCSVAVGQPLKS